VPKDYNSNMHRWDDERRVFYEGFQVRVTKPEELKLSSEELRKKWKREEIEHRTDLDNLTKRRNKMLAMGFTVGQATNPKPFQEYGIEFRYTHEFFEHVWGWWFDEKRENPTPAEDAAKLKKTLARVGELKRVEVAEYGNQNIRVRVEKSKEEIKKAALAGKILPQQETEEEAGEALKSARLEIRKEVARLEAECQPILDAIIKKLLEVADAMADSLIGDELEQHGKHDGLLGFEYCPGRFVIALRQLPWRLKEVLQGWMEHKVRNLGIKL